MSISCDFLVIGGGVGTLAFGSGADFSGGLGAATTHMPGGAYNYGLSWGVTAAPDQTPDEIGAYANPTGPDGTLYFTVDLHNVTAAAGANFTLWQLDNASPTQCSPSEIYNGAPPVWSPGTGTRVGVGLRSATILNVAIGNAIENGC